MRMERSSPIFVYMIAVKSCGDSLKRGDGSKKTVLSLRSRKILNGEQIEEEDWGRQEYRIESQTNSKIELRHLESDYLFVEYRISRFEFPICEAGV